MVMHPSGQDPAVRLLSEALELEPAAREAFLDAACAGDSTLRARVGRLLEQQAMRTIAPSMGAAANAIAAAHGHGAGKPRGHDEGVSGRKVGNYTILEVLGEGGMGTVYLAEQDSPRRHVALKVIRAGLLSKTVMRRFEGESAVLGRLHHPGIGQIYEAGTANVGGVEVPYFAMEYVRGLPLTDYAETHKLETRQRLALFALVCDAVHHAHQKGVIHRDLKPGNILVEDASGSGERPSSEALTTRIGDVTRSRFGIMAQPKILDFGIARVTDSDIQQATIQTGVGQLVGTIPYMSPEQVGGDPADLDIRSDVYTLGVILYELLAGRLPHDVSKKTIPDAVRIIGMEPPTSLSAVNKAFRGEVQTIVEKAIEKDKRRRYQSASDLADDIRRYLCDQPITARPASSVYKLSKFAKRNMGLVGGIAAAAVILAAGVMGVSYQAARATAGWNKAEDNLRLAEEARKSAETEATTAKDVAELMRKMLTGVDPDLADGREVTARELLDAAALTIESDEELRPFVEANVRGLISQSYRGIGRIQEGEAQLRKGYDVARAEFGESSPVTLDLARNMATLLAEKGAFDEAERVCRETLAIVEKQFGADALITAQVRGDLGRITAETGNNKEAEKILTASLETVSRDLGAESKDALSLKNNLASVKRALGQLNEAERMQREILTAHLKRLPPEHPQVLYAKNNIAGIMQKLGRNDEAAVMFRETLAAREKVLGAQHINTTTTRLNLAVCLAASGKPAEAEPLIRTCIDIYTRELGEEHPKTIVALGNLAYVDEDLGKMDEAEHIYRRVLALRRKGSNGTKDPECWSSINNLAGILVSRQKYAEAAALYAEVLTACEEALPDDHYAVAIYRNNSGECLTKLGRYEEAETLLTQSQKVIEKFFGPNHARTTKGLKRLEALYNAWGKSDKAAEVKGRLAGGSGEVK